MSPIPSSGSQNS
jgi:hypothetical protein